MTHIRKVGLNKGKARIWLEGNELISNGIEHGMRYNVMPVAGGLLIDIDPDGKRKIAGTAKRPIIDMSGRTVEAGGFAAGDSFSVTRTDRVGGLLLQKVAS